MPKISRPNITTIGLCGLILLLTVQVSTITAAERQASQRAPFDLAPLSEVAEWTAPPIDFEQIQREDQANEGRKDIPYRVGVPMATNLTPVNSGTWQDLPDGGQVWRLKVRSVDALWTVLGFGSFHLQAGGELRIYDVDRKALFGPYTAVDVQSHGELWFPPIAVDRLVVELYWPQELRNEEPRLRLTTVSHGYKPWGVLGREEDTSADRVPGSAGACNIDTACPEGDDWADEARGSVMVLAGGSGNCSGSILNTTAEDCKAMLLTAAHCGESGPSTTIGFNYACTTCGCTTDPGTITANTMTGGFLRGNSAASDFTLIEMEDPLPESYNPFLVGWSRDPNPPASTAVISYPRGDVRKIAFDFDPPVDGSNWGPNHWRIDDSNPDPAHLAYELGTTEPASSGSPLFDNNHRVIGQLHGGTASCTSDTYDEYGKVDVSWVGGGTPATRMSDWLDPIGSGVMFVDGIDLQDCLFQPAGTIDITRDVYSCDDLLTLKVRDDSLQGAGTVQATIYSDSELSPETVTLTEDTPGSGDFTSTILVDNSPPSNGDGVLSVLHGETITAEYIDADDGVGGTNLLRQDVATTDCAPPVITNVQSSDVTGKSALISWDTDEPADSTVKFGLVTPDQQAFDNTLVTAHLLKVDALQECSPYVYSVSSSDVVSNGASDDNDGAYYTFETGKKSEPEFASTDTPIAILSSATHLSTIAVTDDVAVQQVKVSIDITHTFDGDLDMTLITPDGTRILLAADVGSSGDNYTNTVFDDEATTPIASGTAPFTGSFQPQSPLSAAIGQSSLGDWTLEVIDDAGGDEGTLNSWTLILTYPGQACGPSAEFNQHGLEDDSCSTGAGDNNAFWEAGEVIQFSVALKNNGTDPLTGVAATVNPTTPGVVMLDNVASFPDLLEGASGASASPHYTALLPAGISCAGQVAFDVQISANEGSWSGNFGQTVGEVVPGGGVAFSEDFETAGIPATWTVVDGLADGNTWFADDATDPAACVNTDPLAPVAGTWAAADSDCAGSGVTLDESLITPLIDLSAALTAAAEFDHFFQFYSSGGAEKAELDVRSALTGGIWTTVASWVASTPNPDHAAIDITAEAAGAGDVQLRWHYYDAIFDWWWYVDNVEVTFTNAGACNMLTCAPVPGAPPVVPAMGVNKLVADGSELELTWDGSCSPANTKVIYGSLASVSSLAITGSVCGIANPEVWNPAPAGDIWMLLVSDDGGSLEGSWGSGAGAERNGLVDSGTCGSSSKDITGTCP